jgi:hypothetical protein
MAPEVWNLKNCQDGKLFFEPMEYAGGHQYPPGSLIIYQPIGHLIDIVPPRPTLGKILSST